MADEESSQKTKTCTTCGDTKPQEAFSFSGKGYNARRHPGPRRQDCRQCCKAFWFRQWSAKHREERRIYVSTYQQEHQEEIALRMQTYKAMHRVQQANLQRNREARKKALPDTFTYAQEQFCRQYFHYACAICGQQEGFTFTLALDHWIPLSSLTCPGTIATNIVILCHGENGCNNSKHNKDPHQWLLRKFGKRKAQHILRIVEMYFAAVRERFPAS